jgi:hypothetical protein
MALALPTVPPVKDTYCKVRSTAFAGESCHVPFEPGWLGEPRGLRRGELIEPDMMMDITAIFMDNSINLPLADNLVLSVWFATWFMYIVVTFGIIYTVSWCLCMRQIIVEN